MKRTLKYLASFVAIAAVFAACKPTPEEEGSAEVVPSAGIDVTVSNLTDDSFEVTFAPKGESAYYSYLIDNDEADTSVSAEDIYKVAYSSVAQGTVKYAEQKSYSIKLSDLDPNTTYTIYAVAGSPTGVVSDLVIKTVVTTDTGAPSIGDYEYDGEGTTLLVFSEDVREGSGNITIDYYAVYHIHMAMYYDEDVYPDGRITIPVSEATYRGNYVLVSTDELPAGAYYTVSYPAGAFKDGIGNDCPALSSTITGLKRDWSASGRGLIAYMDNVPFELGEFETTEYRFSPSYVVTPVPEDIELFDYDDEVTGSVSYEGPERDLILKKTVFDEDFDINDDWDQILFILPVAAQNGDKVTVKYAEDTFFDAYGNGNAAWEGSFTVNDPYADYYGTYKVTGTDAVSGEDFEGYFVIDRNIRGYGTSAAQINSLIETRTFGGQDYPVNIRFRYYLKARITDGKNAAYGYVDEEKGTLTLYSCATNDSFLIYDWDWEYGYYFGTGAGPYKVSDTTPLTFKVDNEDGVVVLTEPNQELAIWRKWASELWINVQKEDFEAVKINSSITNGYNDGGLNTKEE